MDARQMKAWCELDSILTYGALRLAQHDEHLARAIRPYVDRYGVKGMRRILDAATVATLPQEMER